VQYGRWPRPSRQVIPAQVQSNQEPMQPTSDIAVTAYVQARDFAGLTAQVRTVIGPPAQAAAQSAPEHNVAGPSALHHALPGPSRAAPPTQGQEVALQHAMPGPSGTQVQSEYKNVSISTWL
jgi:hypothetical protein